MESDLIPVRPRLNEGAVAEVLQALPPRQVAHRLAIDRRLRLPERLHDRGGNGLALAEDGEAPESLAVGIGEIREAQRQRVEEVVLVRFGALAVQFLGVEALQPVGEVHSGSA